jgi:antitoxin CptB
VIQVECFKISRRLTMKYVANVGSIEGNYVVAQVLTHDFSPICPIAIEWRSSFRYGATMTEDDHNRMRWASRRGLLELDLFLADFVADEYPRLSPDLKALYRELMSSADQDMFEWLMGRSNPDDGLQPIVSAIREYKRGAPER